MYELTLTKDRVISIKKFSIEGMWLKYTTDKGRTEYVGIVAVENITQNGKQVKWI